MGTSSSNARSSVGEENVSQNTQACEVGSFVLVKKLQKFGVVIRHDPDDLELAFKVRLQDGREDWFHCDTVEAASADMANDPSSPLSDVTPSLACKPQNERLLRVWLGGWAAVKLGHVEAETPDNMFYIAFEEGRGPKLGSIYDINADAVLGEGSFATTVVATHDDRPCCVKIIDKQSSGEEYRQKVVENVHFYLRMSKAIGHPNIVAYYDFFESDSRYFAVMEKLDGEELFDRFIRLHPITENQIKTILTQILEALNRVHQHGFVHRDIKLENFRYASPDSDTLKLLDFGMIRRAGAKWEEQICGTMLYLAPEIVENVPVEDHEGYLVASDVWAIGVCFYILLAGKAPLTESEIWKLRGNGNSLISKALAHSCLSHASRDARSLLKSFLEVDPHSRISCQDALKHPFFTGDRPTMTSATLDSYDKVRSMSRYSIKIACDTVHKAQDISPVGPGRKTGCGVIAVPVCRPPPIESSNSIGSINSNDFAF